MVLLTNFMRSVNVFIKHCILCLIFIIIILFCFINIFKYFFFVFFHLILSLFLYFSNLSLQNLNCSNCICNYYFCLPIFRLNQFKNKIKMENMELLIKYCKIYQSLALTISHFKTTKFL